MPGPPTSADYASEQVTGGNHGASAAERTREAEVRQDDAGQEPVHVEVHTACLLYTSDAADE